MTMNKPKIDRATYRKLNDETANRWLHEVFRSPGRKRLLSWPPTVTQRLCRAPGDNRYVTGGATLSQRKITPDNWERHGLKKWVEEWGKVQVIPYEDDHQLIGYVFPNSTKTSAYVAVHAGPWSGGHVVSLTTEINANSMTHETIPLLDIANECSDLLSHLVARIACWLGLQIRGFDDDSRKHWGIEYPESFHPLAHAFEASDGHVSAVCPKSRDLLVTNSEALKNGDLPTDTEVVHALTSVIWEGKGLSRRLHDTIQFPRAKSNSEDGDLWEDLGSLPDTASAIKPIHADTRLPVVLDLGGSFWVQEARCGACGQRVLVKLPESKLNPPPPHGAWRCPTCRKNEVVV